MFDVRPYLYGGSFGAVLGSFETLEEAEAAFGDSGEQQLVVLFRDAEGNGLTREVARRSTDGMWFRLS